MKRDYKEAEQLVDQFTKVAMERYASPEAWEEYRRSREAMIDVVLAPEDEKPHDKVLSTADLNRALAMLNNPHLNSISAGICVQNIRDSHERLRRLLWIRRWDKAGWLMKETWDEVDEILKGASWTDISS